MSLAELKRLRAGAFRPSNELADLPIDHVDFDTLVGRQVAEQRLRAALTQEGDRGRVAVIGPSGAGKSSLIARTLASLGDQHHVALIIQVGNAGEALQDPGGFARFVLEELRGQVETILAPSQRAVLERGAVTKRLRTKAQSGANLTLKLPLIPVSIAGDLKGSIVSEEQTIGTPTAVATLKRAMFIIGARDRRPVLVLDDTDKWAGGLDGEIDRPAAEAFFYHGVRKLADVDCDLVIALQDRFLELTAYKQITRFITDQIVVPRFDDPRQPIIEILARRMRNDDIETTVEDLVSFEALALLGAAYAERGQDLRFMLNVMHEAVGRAVREEADKIERMHVHVAADDVRRRVRN